MTASDDHLSLSFSRVSDMWVLESDGDLLEGMSKRLSILEESLRRPTGKRVWLKPGKKYLFGRIKSEGGKIGIFIVC